MNKLAHKTALVTGGTSRIGEQIVLDLAREGVDVALHYNTARDRARKLREELAEEYEVKIVTIQADFNQQGQLRGVIEQVRDEFGHLDLLVNNASIFNRGSLPTMNLEELTHNLQINSWAPFLLGREMARRESDGAIVNLLDARIGGYHWNEVPYGLSKKLLAQLTKMSALEFAPDIRVNGVAPGIISPPPDGDQSYVEKRLHRVPLQRSGKVENVANAVKYLIGSEFITGEIIYVDGGRHLLEEQTP